MNITINTIYNKPININIPSNYTILSLKYLIQDQIGVHPDCQYLYFNNIFLNDDNKLISEYFIKNTDVIIQTDRIIKL
jgi:hypothetical protein